MSGFAKTLLLAWALTAGGASAAGPGAVADRYFGVGWAKADPASVPAAPAAPAPAPDKPVHADHSPVVHMHLTLMAYRLYASRYDGGELGRYIGGTSGSEPRRDQYGTVVEGAYDEDQPFKNPWNQLISEMRHFWDRRDGPYKGLFGCDSAVDRAQKYFTGGYDLDGSYDGGWSGNGGSHRGEKGQGVVALYRAGDKAKAYWYLGHAAHLLEDMTVPAHTLLWPHPLKGVDAYETFTKTHFREWSRPSGEIESFDSLFDLFDQTAGVTDGYDAGNGPGPLRGRDGELDMGWRREDGFTDAELHEEGDVLMPLAYRRVAALFLYFYKQIDRTPPRVTLVFPRSSDETAPEAVLGAGAVLRARAVDDVSGVDRRGYRFEAAVKTGSSWSAWREVPKSGEAEAILPVESGRAYAVRVSAVDAAGNRGVSPVGYLAAPAAVASAPKKNLSAL